MFVESEIARLSKQGLTPHAISVHMGGSSRTIRRRLSEMGIEPTPPNKVNYWTPQEDELLKSLIDEGNSASKCAAAIGRTRNAILGRCDRIGISFPARITKHPRQPRKRPYVPRGNHGKRRAPSYYDAPEIVANPVPYFQNTGCPEIVDMGTGVHDRLCCGAPRFPGEHYCAHHCRINYQSNKRAA